MQQQLIRTHQLSFRYAQEEESKQALDRVDLKIHRGEFVAIVGQNGSGKSTLAKHFNALLTPSSGTVIVDGISTSDEGLVFEIRRRVGMVFQNPDNQLVATMVEEDVAFAPENLGVDPKEIRVRVDNALREVGMYDYRTHAPGQLSGGQKQRVAIAGILAMQPECILLDEATAMLDPQGRQEVMSIVRRLNRERSATVVHITHFMEEAALADRVIVIDNGRVLLEGSPREVFARSDLLEQAGLAPPQITLFVNALAARGVLPLQTVITEDECFQTLCAVLEGGLDDHT